MATPPGHVDFRDSKSQITTDPLRNFKFHVNINHGVGEYQMIKLGFMSVTGLALTTESIQYREGGFNTTTQKMAGQTDFSPITMSRGMIPYTRQAWNWVREIFSTVAGNGAGPSGNDYRSNAEILVFAHPVTKGPTPIKMRIKVYNMWPTSIAYSDLDAGANALLMEQITFAHEGFRINWGGASAASYAVPFSN